jgi:hypothetical protein
VLSRLAVLPARGHMAIRMARLRVLPAGSLLSTRTGLLCTAELLGSLLPALLRLLNRGGEAEPRWRRRGFLFAISLVGDDPDGTGLMNAASS